MVLKIVVLWVMWPQKSFWWHEYTCLKLAYCELTALHSLTMLVLTLTRLWDVRSGKIVQTLETKSPVTSAEVSQDGRYITTADGSTVKFWDANQYVQLTGTILLHFFSMSMEPEAFPHLFNAIQFRTCQKLQHAMHCRVSFPWTQVWQQVYCWRRRHVGSHFWFPHRRRNWLVL